MRNGRLSRRRGCLYQPVAFTVGIVPLLVFASFKVRRRGKSGAETEPREGRGRGVFWAFLTGILGGVGNMAYFEAMVKGGKASVVTPVTALFPMVTVLLALVFLKERLGRMLQWIASASHSSPSIC